MKELVLKERGSTGAQTRRLLLIGFGGLLLLLALSGINTLSALVRIQNENERIRQDYVRRDRLLEDLRSHLYLAGTYVRDLLLEPDPARADIHRAELNAVETRVSSLVSAYEALLGEEEKIPFERFKEEIAGYFDSFRPALEWSANERRERGYEFMQTSLLPKRATLVDLADHIGDLSEQQMKKASARVESLFAKSRTDFAWLLAAALIGGFILAYGSVRRILSLERLSAKRLNESLEARRALQDLSARLVEVQETERKSLARELHDEVGQALSALLLAIGNTVATISQQSPEARSQFLDMRRLAEKTVATVRDICLLLRPSMLDDLGLVPALEWQAREIARTNQIRVTVDADSALEDLSDEHKTCIYRVVQEALHNVARHARAKIVEIALAEDEDALHLSIKDDGRGFRPEREKGVGLLGMEERVTRLAGAFRVESEPGAGTTIDVLLPRSAPAAMRAN